MGLALVGSLGGAWSAEALAPDKALRQFPHKNWRAADGLPQNSVLSLAQTDDGYLWAGTWEGLVRFDGTRLTVFDRANTPALMGRSIRSLVVDQDKALWIGTEGGLTRMAEGTFVPVTPPEGTVLRNVQDLLLARDGSLWIATNGHGLLRLSRGHFQVWKAEQGLASDVVTVLAEDGAGILWVGTTAGLQWWDGTALRAAEAAVSPGAVVSAMARDLEGVLWVGTEQGQVYRMRGGGLHPVPEASMPGVAISVLRADQHGTLWVGSLGRGLARVPGDERSPLKVVRGLETSQIIALLEDAEGNLWVGMEAGGLTRLKDAPFTPYGPTEGLAHQMVSSIHQARDGSVWLATLGGGVSRWRDGQMTSWTTREGLAHDRVRSIAEGKDGSLWFGTQSGVSRWYRGSFTSLGLAQGLPDVPVRTLSEDARGTLWVGTRAGLSRWSGERFEPLSQADGVPGREITLLKASAAGGVWVGTGGGGLAHLLEGKSHLLAPEQGPLRSEVQTLHEDASGTLWIGTDEGLYRWKAGRFTRFSTAEGLFDDRIFQILADGRGNLWMSCNKGIFRVAQAELEAVAEGRLARVASRAYGAEDGMRSEECNGYGTPAGWRSQDGRLWFATIEGAAVYDPAQAEVRAALPPVLIEEVRVDGRSVAASERGRVPAGTGQVEFHYTAAGLRDPQRLRFRYQLEGVDEDWVEAGPRRVAYYTQLPPGDYRFRVQAQEVDGRGAPGAEVALSLQPRFHQTGLFRVACGLGAVLAVAGGVLLRMYQMRRRERELQARVEARTAELATVNADLKAHLQELRTARAQLVHAEKMAAVGTLAAGIGHEINNPLAFIISNLHYVAEEVRGGAAEQGTARWREVEQALEETLQGADRVRRIVRDLKTFSHSQPERPRRVDLHEVLGLAMAMAEAETRHRAQVVKDYGTPPAVFGDATRIGQVFLNLLINAAQAIPEGHADCHEIRVTTRQDAQGRAVVAVSDTGAGIPPEVLPRIFEPFFTTKPVGVGTGLGLSICYTFIQALGGHIQVRSEQGRGTTFEVILPPAPEELEVASEVHTLVKAARGRRGRLLLIDDEPLVTSALCRTLAPEHDVVALNSARQALARLRTGEHYDLILCDLMMPEMTGMELHATLTRDAPRLAERMVFLTGGAFTEASSAFLQATLLPWLEKPFEPGALRARIRALLEAQPSQQHARSA